MASTPISGTAAVGSKSRSNNPEKVSRRSITITSNQALLMRGTFLNATALLSSFTGLFSKRGDFSNAHIFSSTLRIRFRSKTRSSITKASVIFLFIKNLKINCFVRTKQRRIEFLVPKEKRRTTVLVERNRRKKVSILIQSLQLLG